MKYFKILMFGLTLPIAVTAQIDTNSQHFYLFTYFINANDIGGARLAVSADGVTWQKINDEQAVFIPSISSEHKARDPYTYYEARTGVFYMVWTTGWNQKNIGFSMSKDLISWTTQTELDVGKKIDNCSCCWAPEIFYDDIKDSFMIYWSTEKGTSGKRSYYVMTKDFATLTDPTLFFDPGYTVIDDDILKVAAGKYYMFFKDERSPSDAGQQAQNIHYVYGATPQGPWSAVSKWITTPGCEGPCAIKMGNEYWIYFDPFVVFTSTYRVVKVANLDTTASPWPQGPLLKTTTGGNFLYSHGHIIEIPRAKLMQLLYNVKDTKTYQQSAAWNFYSDTAVVKYYPLGKRNTGCGTGVGLAFIPPIFFSVAAFCKRRRKDNRFKFRIPFLCRK